MRPGILEKLVQLLLAVSHPHIQHIIDADADESRSNLARCGPCNMRLAATGGAIHQDSATDRFSIRSKHLAMLHRIDDLHADFFFERIHPSHGGKVDRRSLEGIRDGGRGFFIAVPAGSNFPVDDFRRFVSVDPQFRSQDIVAKRLVLTHGLFVFADGEFDIPLLQQQSRMKQIGRRRGVALSDHLFNNHDGMR